LRWGNGRLPSLTYPVETRQFFLERVIEEFVSVLAQKDKQFGFPDPFHDLFFLRR